MRHASDDGAKRQSSQHVRQQPHHAEHAQLSTLHRCYRGMHTAFTKHMGDGLAGCTFCVDTHTLQGCGDSANTRHCDCKNLRQVYCRPPDGWGVAIHGCCKPCTKCKACASHHAHTYIHTLYKFTAACLACPSNAMRVLLPWFYAP